LEFEGKQYEFERKGTAARWTFVIDQDGKIAYMNTRVTPALDAKAITDFITKAKEQT
jgi:peroxiredoxin Q/BCP